MKYTELFSIEKQGITASLGLHLCFALLLYYTKLASASGNSSGQTYTIGLQIKDVVCMSKQNNPVAIHTPDEQLPQIVQKEQQKSFENKQRNKPTSSRKPTVAKKTSLQKGFQSPLLKQTVKIDARGLYARRPQKQLQTGATLELTGWKWDSVPHPKDNTEEYGRLVFEIKVDENGEVIAIRTLEKTVSPLVEKIYADALQMITFSKTSSTQPYASVSTGKVMFVLVPK